MGATRRRFSLEFKREAVRLAFKSGASVSQVAGELDLRTDMLRRWRRELSVRVRSRRRPSRRYAGCGGSWCGRRKSGTS